MRPRRYLLDTTLRDGEQQPGLSFTCEQKIEIAKLLDESGVHQIEAGIPASSARDKNTILKIIERRKKAVVSVWARMSASDIVHAVEVRPDMVHISVPVSYSHIYAKLRKNKQWVVNQLNACIEIVEKSGIPMSVGLEDAFRSEPMFMTAIARILLDAGVNRIRFADTVGVASPSVCRSVISEFVSRLTTQPELGFHAHNDLGMAVANTVEAAKAGCMYADVTAGGIGERAGNCNLAQLVQASSQNFDWGLSPAQAWELQSEIIEVWKGRNKCE